MEILIPEKISDMAYIVPMHVKPKFTYLLTEKISFILKHV